jgi:protein-S-isoprenylcysteine O-methyltransferase Ste14
LSLGGVFARLTIYSFVFFLLVGLGFLVHTRRIEDGELVQRFGQPFLDYRRRTPGLYIRRRDLRAYFSFLLGHERG